MVTRSHDSIRRDLLELIAALDRRVPRVEREGERAIARDAQALRCAALKQLAELERAVPAPPGNVAREPA